MISEQLLGIYCGHSAFLQNAQHIAERLEKPILSKPPLLLPVDHFVIVISERGVALQATGKKASGPVYVDFVTGSVGHRRQFGGGKGQMIAKAVGIKGQYRPQVIDVTAGLGQDAFVLATLGCQLQLVERSPVVYELLSDGMSRAELVLDSELQIILQRMQLSHSHSIDYLLALNEPAEVIYVDPMFPERKSKAGVNKNMQAFHSLVGEDNDAGELLAVALDKAMYRVVVKRPRKSPTISEQYPALRLPQPALQFEGKSTRYDVYPLKKMPS